MGKKKYNYQAGDTYVERVERGNGRLWYYAIRHIVKVEIKQVRRKDKEVAIEYITFFQINITPNGKFYLHTGHIQRITFNTKMRRSVQWEQFAEQHRLECLLLTGCTLHELIEKAKERHRKHKKRYAIDIDPEGNSNFRGIVMRKELDEKLCATFPNLYRDRHASMMATCMCWGFDCGNGWYDIVYKLSEKLEAEILKLPEEDQQQCCAAQVKEKYGCYDELTEVLTESGWKYFKDITKSDKIACLTEGKYLTYQCPTDIISYSYSGPMYKLQTRGVDLFVTPNHNLYVAKPPKVNGYKRGNVKYTPYPFELTTYDKYQGKNKVFKKGAVWVGQERSEFILPEIKWTSTYRTKHKTGQRYYSKPELTIDMDAWLNFLGWYVAEGCCSKYNKCEVMVAYNSLNRQEEREIVDAIRAVGFVPTICKESNVIRFCSKQMVTWLIKECKHYAYNKRVPEFIQALSPRQIRIFIESLYKGDGHKAKSSHILTTVSKGLADQVQELLLKIGEVGHITIRKAGQWSQDRSGIGKQGKQYNILATKRDSYYINRLKKEFHQTQAKGLAPSSIEQMEVYDGMVYCVTVPEHVIYVRRNGKPVWCGNSLRFYLTISTDKMEELIREAEKESSKTCETCGEPGVLRGMGWFFTACEKHSDGQRPYGEIGCEE